MLLFGEILGKAADLVVIDQNLFKIPETRISKTKVLLTILAGKIVYEHPKNGLSTYTKEDVDFYVLVGAGFKPTPT